MKTQFAALAVLAFSWNAFAYNCTRTVDQKEVVVFVDTNNSPTEIEGAAKAACARGQAFKKIPSSGSVYKDELTKELKALAGANKAVVSMVISGHDGGGHMHGSTGSVSKTEAIAALKEAYAKKPALLNQFQSVFMWGCWSMGPAEVEIWRKELPSLKMASGFIDMGPLNTTRATHTVLEGLLTKEKDLIAQSNQTTLKRQIAAVQDLNSTYAAVYTEAACGNMYYYNTDGNPYESGNDGSPLFTQGTHFVDYDKNFNCDAMAPDIEKARKDIIPYFYGSKPLPPDGPNNPIRGIYSFLRKAQKCIKPNHMLNPDRIMLLRFFEEVKQNFANVFSNEITEANKEIIYVKGSAESKPASASKKALLAYYNANKGKYFNPRYDTLKGKSRKEINEMISYLDGLVKQPYYKEGKNYQKVDALKKLRNAMDQYLFNMNPSCMNFLEWHEVVPGRNPGAYCNN